MEVFGSCSKYCTVKYAYSCIVFKYRVGSGSGPFCPDQVSVKKKVGIRSTALLRQLFPPCYHKNYGLTIKYQPEEGGWGIFYIPPPIRGIEATAACWTMDRNPYTLSTRQWSRTGIINCHGSDSLLSRRDLCNTE